MCLHTVKTRYCSQHCAFFSYVESVALCILPSSKMLLYSHRREKQWCTGRDEQLEQRDMCKVGTFKLALLLEHPLNEKLIHCQVSAGKEVEQLAKSIFRVSLALCLAVVLRELWAWTSGSETWDGPLLEAGFSIDNPPDEFTLNRSLIKVSIRANFTCTIILFMEGKI